MDITPILTQKFPGITYHSDTDMPVYVIEPSLLFEAIRFLKEDPSCQFQFLTDLCGIHHPSEKAGVLGVVYHLHNLNRNSRIRVKSYQPESHPIFPSMTPLFASANWMERETYDFFGIQFEGHPNLTRILNMDDMTTFPLRKEQPLEDSTRTDKQDAYFGR